MFIFAATAMINSNKGKAKSFLTFLLLLQIVGVALAYTHNLPFSGNFDNKLTTASDSIPVKKQPKKPSNTKATAAKLRDTLPKPAASTALADTIQPSDSAAKTPITTQVVKVDTMDVKLSKDSMQGPVYYHADDSMVMDVPSKKIMLYGKKSNTKYLDNDLSAPGIIFDQQNNMLTAYHVKDSNGRVIASPMFKQKDMTTMSDTIAFNIKTGKGITKGTYTQQGEMYIYGERIKKIDSSAFFAYKARFTTCNLDTPHFAFVSKKIKFINNKFAITGPVHPEFEGVPVPLVLPFGIYPMYQGRHSGLIAPSFTANQQFGLALEGLGYYKVLSDNWDVTMRGTIYSYGGWTMNISPRYYKRYHYTGNLSLDIQKTKFNFKGDPDYSQTNTFSIRWSHTMDSKARPGVTFSANVRAASSKFNRLVPNNPMRNLDNQLSSSISWAKVWKDKPFNISVNANHAQNTINSSISVTLPEVTFNVNTLYPFRRKEPTGSLKWYENIGIALNSNMRSLTSFTDDTARDVRPIFQQAAKNLQWGGSHNVPISLSLPPLGPLQVSPNISYSERWFQRKTTLSWNPTTKKIDTAKNDGFFTAREMSFGLGMSTRIFGMFGFGKNSRIKAIRHEIRPQISASYTPNMNGKYYYSVQSDTSGNLQRYTVFRDNIVGAYGEGEFGGLSFGFDNVIQMKVKDKKDTTAGSEKKVTLIDGLNIGSSYNFLVDSFQLTAFNLGARTNLFDKINITASAYIDPYVYDDTTGRRMNRLIWKDKIFSLGKLMNASLSLGCSFKGGDKNKKTENKALKNAIPIDPRTGLPMDDTQAEAAYIRTNPGEFADFSIPWSVSLGISMRYSNSFNSTEKKFSGTMTSDMSFNGTLNLTPKWQLGVNGLYNIKLGDLSMLTMSISREMHCWQMFINVSPMGPSRFFNITISPKSALLRDVRINRTRYFFDL